MTTWRAAGAHSHWDAAGRRATVGPPWIGGTGITGRCHGIGCEWALGRGRAGHRASPGAGMTYQAFLAGVMPGPARTMFSGRHSSVQIYLTPVGAHRLLAAPGTETAARVLPAADVLPRSIRNLPERLADAGTWEERFALVTEVLLALATSPAAVDELVPWMWRELRRSGGRVRVDQLARASGWRVRHVSHRFTESAGIAPKLAAQLIRFERAHAALSAASLADVAARSGYADQSHLARDARFRIAVHGEFSPRWHPRAPTSVDQAPT